MSDNWFYEYFINEAKSIIRPCSGGGSVPKPLIYDYMPEGYPSKSVQTVTLMEEQEVAFSDMEGIYAAVSPVEFELTEGETYTVVWDGVEYKCVCHTAAIGPTTDGPYIGNPAAFGLEPTGEPFVYVIIEGGRMWVSYDTATTHTISVKTVTEVITPMTYDYMPEGYPRKSVQTTLLIKEQELAFTAGLNDLYGAKPPNRIYPVEGRTYTVNWDGIEYECVCVIIKSIPYLGNLSIMRKGADTGEPFLYEPDEPVFITRDTSASHTISVKRIEKTLTPMAKEFLPNIPAGANSTTVFYI